MALFSSFPKQLSFFNILYLFLLPGADSESMGKDFSAFANNKQHTLNLEYATYD